MLKRIPIPMFFALMATLSFLYAAPSQIAAAPPNASPIAIAPYTLSIFAKSATSYSQPDSLIQWRDRVFVGFQNHVAKDGTDGKSSTIVEYSLNGAIKRTFSVPGHNDGLRIVGEDDLWALQNEDANPNLVVIDLESGRQKTFTFAPTLHGGGFDDMVVKNGKVLMTASNPNLNGAGVNTFPALVIATLHGSTVEVEPVLNGDAHAIDISTGADSTLNLTDPDSLTSDLRGNIVLNSQADAELIFIKHPFSNFPAVGRLPITVGGVATTVDDTAFVTNAGSFLLFSDVGADTVYRVDSPTFGFEPGTAYSTSDTAGIVGALNLDNGVLTPLATGFVSARGLISVTPDQDDRHNDGN